MLEAKLGDDPFRVTQPVFTCSKIKTETLEQGMKYVQN